MQAFSNPIFFKLKLRVMAVKKIISTLKTITVPKSALRFFLVVFYFELLISFKGPNRKKEYIAAQGKVY